MIHHRLVPPCSGPFGKWLYQAETERVAVMP
jgi:hypothetical protein